MLNRVFKLSSLKTPIVLKFTEKMLECLFRDLKLIRYAQDPGDKPLHHRQGETTKALG